MKFSAVDYDPAVIRGYAHKMYSRAAMMTMLYTIIGALFFGVVGLLLGLSLGLADSGTMFAGVFGMIGVAVGYWIGNMKANALRLEAQIALCQVQIEMNTRQ